MRLILGSASPRRLEILAQIGIVPDTVLPPDIDETEKPREQPRDYCRRIALEKVHAVPCSPEDIVLCGDTTVALGRRIMGKPDDAGKAAEFLYKLSGRRHRVITAIAVKRGDRIWQRDVVSAVRFKVLSDDDVNSYLATDDWRGKAGAYAIQGPAAMFIPWMQGSYSAVMGLPAHETAKLLTAAGYPTLAPRR